MKPRLCLSLRDELLPSAGPGQLSVFPLTLFVVHTALENYSDRRGLLSGVVYEFVLEYEFIHPECTYSATQNSLKFCQRQNSYTFFNTEPIESMNSSTIFL